MANIRTARRSGRVFRGGGFRRESQWIQIAPTVSNLGTASTAVLFTGFGAVALGLRPFTIVRTHINLHVASDQEVNDELQQVAIGTAVVSDQALAIGVTAVPTPFTDMGSDLWMLHQILTTRFLLGTAVGFSGDFGKEKDIDSRAMRKVEEGSDLAMSIETSSISAGADVAKAGRILIKLH